MGSLVEAPHHPSSRTRTSSLLHIPLSTLALRLSLSFSSKNSQAAASSKRRPDKPPRSKSALLARRLSNPHPTPPSTPGLSTYSPLHARSSPDLGGPGFFQAFTSPSPPPSPPHSRRQPSEDSDRSNPSPTPVRPARAPSPPQDATERAAAHAEALAKLSAPTPARPNRPPPPPPTSVGTLRIEDRAERRVSLERRGSSDWERRALQPITPSRVRKSSKLVDPNLPATTSRPVRARSITQQPSTEPAPTPSVSFAPSHKIYGDRRLAESAIDVLGVVDEDSEGAGGRHRQRHSLGGPDESPRKLSWSSPARPTRRSSERLSPPPAISLEIPFPSSELDDPSPPPVPSERRKHKRWNSELHRADELQFPPPRTRHQSYGGSTGGSVEGKSSPAARTKLVLREDGRPTLTYQLGECIGRGQFGSVYRALNLNSGRVVAVKRIALAGKSEEEVSQLSNEVAMLKSLVHPGVVKYEGVVRTEHYVNIVLEYVENGSLQKTLKHFGELPESLVASYVVKILEGLEYLHRSNVVHCDLKAANILSTKTGNVKLSDFGVSLNLNAVQNLKASVADVQGTPNWMAPEVISLVGASTASDIWSLACTIIELVSGKPPYADLNAMSAMFRIVEDPSPPIPERCSPELRDFLARCFAKDPLQRPTAGELFEHAWLQSHWEIHKELRPQDSIPFIRRISSDMRRPELNVLGGIPERSASSLDLAFFATNSPVSINGPAVPEVRQPSPEILHGATDESHRAHAFVKTTFSKPVDCKLCHEPTKKHAVLCQDCGLIAHARCSEWAPVPCDLRSQLVNYSKTHLPPSPRPAFPFRRPSKPPTADRTTPPRVRRHFSDIIKPRTRSPEGSLNSDASFEVPPAVEASRSAISLLLSRTPTKGAKVPRSKSQSRTISQPPAVDKGRKEDCVVQ